MNSQTDSKLPNLNSPLSFHDYSILARRTRMDSCNNVCYPFAGLHEELGELDEHLKKYLRFDDESLLRQASSIGIEQQIAMSKSFQIIAKSVRHETTCPPVYFERTALNPESTDKLKSEIGDMLWMLSELSHQLGFSLEDAAIYNIEKLARRAAAKKIDGKGDTEAERTSF